MWEGEKEERMKAFISGVTGQDGSYLAELLLEKGYQIYGIDRRIAIENAQQRYSRIYHILDKIKLYSGDIQNYTRMFEIINEVKPDECFHLAAQSFVGTSFEDEFTVLRTNIEGTVNILNILRKIAPDCRYYFAASSEQFGKVIETPQNENTPFNPRSPYAISKCAGFQFTKLYREAYGMFCCSGILFNHESERRGGEFVTRKIARGTAEIEYNLRKKINLGNLMAKRDWGHASDYVRGMWLMLQQPRPDDYVLATGKTHTVEEFAKVAFEIAGIKNWRNYIEIDQKFMRPAEVNLLLGDASKARRILGWEPKISFKELVGRMVESELKKIKQDG